MNLIDLGYLSPDAFKRTPHVVAPYKLTWPATVEYFSKYAISETEDIELAKREAGSITFALYRGNIQRKANIVHVSALNLDFDETAVDRVAHMLQRYECVVHETAKSTPPEPRCRAFVRFVEPIDVRSYERLHKIIRAQFSADGMPVDASTGDASRLSFCPVRRPGAGYGFRSVEGRPFDALAFLAKHPEPAPAPRPRPPAPEHRDRYVRGALVAAANAVASATPGTRHYQLCREAFCLARFPQLSEHEIEAALLPAFVSSAGERREAEGRRTIADAIREAHARGRAAS